MPRDTVSDAGAPARRNQGKIRSAREAASLIRSGDTVATGGFVGIGFPEAIAVALEARFLDGAAASPDGVGDSLLQHRTSWRCARSLIGSPSA